MSKILLPFVALLVVAGYCSLQAQCPVDEQFPYVFCKDGKSVVRCASDPWHYEENGVRLKPYKRSLPGCLTIDQRRNLDVFMPTYGTGPDIPWAPVFLAERAPNDIADAFNQWTSLCPPTPEHDCCVHIVFSRNPQDFASVNAPEGFTRIVVDVNTCRPSCDDAKSIFLNDTPLWSYGTPDPTPGDSIIHAYFTGRTAPHVAFGYHAVSLFQIMEKLTGNWFGLKSAMDFPDVKACTHPASVMENPVTEDSPTSLTAADICQFKKLYCDHAVGLGVDDNEAKTDGLSLAQNVPNPFRSLTAIPYTLAKSGNVRLIIFDVKGEEIKTLVDEYSEAGDYTFGFHPGNDMPSGTYWYVLHVDNVMRSKQMILVR